MEVKNETPSKSKIVKKVLHPMHCDSPFKRIPNISTPPSRFTKILNPFEQHLVDRLHLPTFSPSVFAQVSTPKPDEKFRWRWTIEDISSLKPADIDEDTISQHVSDQDPTVESLVQEKIEKFFNEKVIVPSPYTNQIKQMPFMTSPLAAPELQYTDSSAQTVLTLPPNLPTHVEEALAPYFTYTSDQQMDDNDRNTSLHRKLFEFEEQSNPSSSPAPSTGLSPIQFSPEFNRYSPKNKRESTMEIPELKDCTLSPIGRSLMSRSACRLSFSGHMSVDASLVVPDVNKSLNCTNLEPYMSFRPLDNVLNDSVVNWDVEYKHISILSRSPVSSPELIDSSNSCTPHSKIFTSQRKRLSDSFRDEEFSEKDVEMEEEKVVPKRLKNRLVIDNVVDAGYHTDSATMCEESSVHMFASTPTKIKH